MSILTVGGTRESSITGGARSFLSITDDYSKMAWVFMTKQKSEAFNFFQALNDSYKELDMKDSKVS